MELFNKLFARMLVFVYHGFDRLVINGYLSMLSRPENLVCFFRQVVGLPSVTQEVLKQRTADYQAWVEAYETLITTSINLPKRESRPPSYFFSFISASAVLWPIPFSIIDHL